MTRQEHHIAEQIRSWIVDAINEAEFRREHAETRSEQFAEDAEEQSYLLGKRRRYRERKEIFRQVMIWVDEEYVDKPWEEDRC